MSITWIDGAVAYDRLIKARLVGCKTVLTCDVASHPQREQLQSAMNDWETSLWKDKRLCFACGEQCWRTPSDQIPAAIVLLWAAGIVDPSEIVIAPVCLSCIRRRDATAHIDRAVLELFPRAQRIDQQPVAGPERLQ